MKAGAKGTISADPLDFTGWPKDRARRRELFIREYLLVPKGVGAGKPVRLRDSQQEIVRGAFAPGIRTALVSIPRANGNTALAAMLAAHVAHCVAKATNNGDLVSKDKRGSPRKTDAAVAAIVALDRAAWHTNNRCKRRASVLSAK